MNSVELTGRLVRDVQTAGTAARFTIAVDRRFKQEGQPTADFISCVAFGKTGDFVSKYFKKGSGIEVMGRIQTGSYDGKNGKVYTTDVVCEQVGFWGSKAADNNDSKGEKGNDFVNIPEGITEDEVPFN